MSESMRAVVQRGFGGTDQLEVTRRAVPTAGAGEVLVRVRAAAIDRGTLLMLEGRPLLARPAFGVRRPRHPVPGLDVSGIVVALGAGVSGVAIGDRVVGISRGALAEYAVVPVSKLAAAPRELDLVTAAALPVSGITAVQAMELAGIGPGDRVLVTGASGGVGHYVVQLAASAGAAVTAVCSAAKADMVRSLGAAAVVPYDERDALRSGTTWDVVVDVMGNAPLRRLCRATVPGGRIVLVGGDTGGRLTAGYGRQLRALVAGPLLGRRVRVLASRERAHTIAALVAAVDDGRVRPSVDRVFALDEIAAALDHLAAGRASGKVVVAVTPPTTR
jgi:NADPH:quinone reductase-like Zn-dependent oxidoreductase